MLVVKTSTVRKAITGTVVGNFMEWFDFGIYGYLAVTMTAVLGMRETAQAPLIGSVPAVETRAEAIELVEGQDENPLIDTTSMPLIDLTPHDGADASLASGAQADDAGSSRAPADPPARTLRRVAPRGRPARSRLRLRSVGGIGHGSLLPRARSDGRAAQNSWRQLVRARSSSSSPRPESTVRIA